MTQTNQCLARFSVRRMQADMEAIQSFVTNRTPQDGLAAWSQAASRCLRDYAALIDDLAAINSGEGDDRAED